MKQHFLFSLGDVVEPFFSPIPRSYSTFARKCHFAHLYILESLVRGNFTATGSIEPSNTREERKTIGNSWVRTQPACWKSNRLHNGL